MFVVINPREIVGTKSFGRSPHLDITVSILAPVSPGSLAGWLGETMSWIGQSDPSLQGRDGDYKVDDLLSHNFKYSTFGVVSSQAGRRLTKFEFMGRTASTLGNRVV